MSTEEGLHLMTKKRLQNLRVGNLGLQQLAVREISKQLTFYRTHPDEHEKLKSLPALLREKILQVLMKKRCLDEQGQEMEFENLKVFFPLLLSPRTRYIELNGILSFCPDRYKDQRIDKVTEWCVKLLKQIERRAPQVETLVIQRNNPFFRCMYTHDQDINFHQEMVQSLLKLQRLNKLQVNLYIFHITDLMKICKNSSRLQYVNIECFYRTGKNQPAPEEILSSFCNLKELIFECPAEENDWLGSLCTRNLPNIEVVQYDPNKIMNWTHIRDFDKRYHGLEFPGASNLRHICVDLLKYVNRAEELEQMPNLFPKVTCLMVKNIGNSFLAENVLPKFNNIRHLQLLNPYGSGIIENYLISYGKKLQSLCMRHDHNKIKIDMELIFKYCPNLEKLSLRNTRFKTPSSKIDFFAELKELELEILYGNVNPDGIHDQEGMVLSTILSAPKLEYFEPE